MNVTILGGGTWGTALAVHLARKHNVSVWEIDKKRVEYVNANRHHDLLNVPVSEKILFTDNIELSMKDAEIVLIVVPSKFVIDTVKKIKNQTNEDTVIIIASKGLDGERTTYESVSSLMPNVAVLSGPSHAEEVVHHKLCGIVIASHSKQLNNKLKLIFENSNFLVETSLDPIGVQLSAAFKNILAIMIGIIKGLELGDNAEAFFLTKGMHQIEQLVVKLGGKKQTFYSLAGLGDILVTCFSSHSRNRTFGSLIGKGRTTEQAKVEVGQVVEGIDALVLVKKLVAQNQMRLPVIDTLYLIVFENKNAKETVLKMFEEMSKNRK